MNRLPWIFGIKVTHTVGQALGGNGYFPFFPTKEGRSGPLYGAGNGKQSLVKCPNVIS